MAYQKGKKIEQGIWRLKGSKEYLAEINYTDPQSGRRFRERKTLNRLDLAKEWRRSRQTDAARGEIRKRKERSSIAFGELADEYAENWSKVEKRETTQYRERTITKNLKACFGQMMISGMVRRDIERYVAKRKGDGVKPTTINRELALLKHILRKAVDWDYLEINPASGVKHQRVEVPEFSILTEEEMDRFIDKASPHLRTIFILALNTGMRRGEIFRLEWRDVDFDQGIITVRKPKNYETRYIPMNASVRDALATQPRRIVVDSEATGRVERRACPYVFSNDDGSPLKAIDTGFQASLNRAGITKHFRFHDMRHTFASHLVMKGVDMRTVAKLMGHKDIKQTMRYAHLAPDHLQAAVEVLTRRESQQGRQQAG